MENLKSFLDDELDLATKAEVEAHLRQNPDLSQLSSEFSAISQALKGVDAGQPYGLDKLEAKLANQGLVNQKATIQIWKFAGLSSILGLVLIAVAFPMFAQPKQASKRGAQMAAAKAAPNQSADTEITSTADTLPLSESDSMGSELKSEQSRTRQMDTSSFNGAVTPFGDDVSSAKAAKSRSLPQASFPKPAEDNGTVKYANPTNTPGAPYGVYLEKSGSVTVLVEELMRAVDEATGMVTSLKGFVVNSDLQNSTDGGTAQMTLRVPTDNFPTAMNKLQAMGEVEAVNSASQDITGETVDSSARTRSWADEEQRLIGELKRAKNNQKWQIRSELNNVRANLEAHRAQLKNLKDRGNFSTIQVTFTRGESSAKGKGWAQGAFGDAKSGLGSIGQILGTLGIYFLVFIPVWLPLAIAGFMIAKRNRA